MDMFLAFLAGLVGGLVAVGVVAFFVFRKLKADPMYQSMKGMQSMMGSMSGFPGGPEEQIKGVRALDLLENMGKKRK